MRRLILFSAALFAMSAQQAVAAPIHAEIPDAAQTIAGAQNVDGDGPVGSPVTNITGTIANGTDADIYRIYISDPTNFSAAFVGGTLGDSQLFLFRADGTGIVANDDDGPGFDALITAPVPGLLAVGHYFLVVSGFDYDPINAANQEIFPNTFTGQQVPGNGGVLSGFAGGSGTGTYNIQLTGVTHSPEPASMLAFGIVGAAGAVYGWRRRKQAKA